LSLLISVVVYLVVVRHRQAMLEHCLRHSPRLSDTGLCLLCNAFLLGRDPDTLRRSFQPQFALG
jgi:hypothetical protein